MKKMCIFATRKSSQMLYLKDYKLIDFQLWRDARAVEWGGLENR